VLSMGRGFISIQSFTLLSWLHLTGWYGLADQRSSILRFSISSASSVPAYYIWPQYYVLQL
jgi:hypothetical protein